MSDSHSSASATAAAIGAARLAAAKKLASWRHRHFNSTALALQEHLLHMQIEYSEQPFTGTTAVLFKNDSILRWCWPKDSRKY